MNLATRIAQEFNTVRAENALLNGLMINASQSSRKSSGWIMLHPMVQPPERLDLWSETDTANVLHFKGWSYDFNGYVKYIPPQDVAIPAAPIATPVTDATIASAAKGQFFALDEELGTDTGFDNAASWTLGTGWSVTGSELVGASVATGINAASTTAISANVGDVLILKFKVTGYTSGSVLPSYEVVSGTFSADASTGIAETGWITRKLTCTATGSFKPIVSSLTAFTGTIDDFSVKLKNDKYQCIANATSQELTNTTYFRPVDQITAQDIVIPKYDVDTDTISFETSLTDTSLLYLDYLHKVGKGYNDITLMAAYGYTRGTSTHIENHIYTKGADDTVLYGAPTLLQRLNRGRYSPFVNELGVYENSTSQAWYVANDMNNAYTAFTNIGVDNGRPDTYTATKTYLSQIIANPAFSQTPSNWPQQVATKMNNGTWDWGHDALIESIVAVKVTITSEAYNSGTAGTYVTFTGGDSIALAGYINNLGAYEKAYIYLEDSPTKLWNISYIDKTYVYLTRSPQFEKEIIDYRGSITPTGNAYICVTKASSVIVSRTMTHTDLVGNPTNYPRTLKDLLAAGKSVVGMSPLLVGQDGTSYIPDGTSKTWTNSKKVVTLLTVPYTTDSGVTWLIDTGESAGYSFITNSRTSIIGTTTVAMKQNTVKASFLQDTVISETLNVLPQVFASNSHAWAKGNAMTYALLGKIGVGNGSNGDESTTLFNFKIAHYDYDRSATAYYDINTRILETGTGDAKEGVIGEVYKPKVDFSGKTLAANHDFSATSAYWEIDTNPLPRVTITPTPSHSTISLDSSVSPACKWFMVEVQDEYGLQRLNQYAVELIKDTTAVTDYAAGSGALDTSTNNIIRLLGFANADFNGKIFTTTLASINWVSTTFDSYYIDQDGVVRDSTGSVFPLNVWDSNRFGDDGMFSQLSNGTMLDDYGNTVITVAKSAQIS